MLTDQSEVPLRKRVTQAFRQFNKRFFMRFGRRAARFVNTQFALIVIAFFVLSLNVVSSPVAVDAATVNPLLGYNPAALIETTRAINPYLPIINQENPDTLADQILSAVVGQETAYLPKPMLVETIDHATADRIRRGLRRETVVHKIAQGETIGKIAVEYGVNVATLLEENSLKPEDTLRIKPGTELRIPPENTTNSLAWLDSLHEAERKKREEAEQARKSKLARANSGRSRSGVVLAADSEAPAGSGSFRKPIGAGCYNGYHWWAIDCPTSVGAAVYAAAGGVVTVADGAGYNGGYGKTIVISHGNGWETRYAHLSNVSVQPGERVGAGVVVGANGNTGNSTGPHLHFELMKDGRRLNPGRYVGY